MLRPYTVEHPFRFWCQKILPLVYDDSLSYYELLNKVVDYLNKNVDNINALGEAFNNLQEYVQNYFTNLDVQQEIDAKLDEMVEDGTLDALIQPLIGDAVSEWLEDNVTPTGSAVLVDNSLAISGAAADAKVTGDKIGDLKSDLNQAFSPMVGGIQRILLDTSEWVNSGNYKITAQNVDAINHDLLIQYDTGYKVYVRGYNAGGTEVYNKNSWYTDEKDITLVRGYNYQITFSKADGSSTPESALEHIRVYKITNLETGKNQINPYEFIVGTWNTLTDAPNTGISYRVCTKEKLTFDRDANIFVIDPTYQVFVTQYSADGSSIVDQTNWSNGTGRQIKAGYKYAFSIKKATEDQATIAYKSEKFFEFCNAVRIIALQEVDTEGIENDIREIENDISLLHLWAVGHITSPINIDATQNKVIVPEGLYYNPCKNTYTNINTSTTLSITSSVENVVCVNFISGTIEIFSYSDYCSKKTENYGVLVAFRTDNLNMYSSPYPVIIDGHNWGYSTDQAKYLLDKIGTVYSKSFDVTGPHSSTRDLLNTNIPSGYSIKLSALFSNNSTISLNWILTDDQNQTYSVTARGGSEKTYTTTAHIVKIGVFFADVGSVTVIEKVQILGELQILEDKLYIDSPDDINSINGDGITKTCSYDVVGKKLYIRNQEDTGPSVDQQGAAYENGKVIIATCQANVSCTLDVWDFDTQTREYTLSVPDDVTGHGNNVIATGVMYNESDLCSLLMVSDNLNGLVICRLTTSGCTVLHKIQFDVADVGYHANFMYNELNGTVVSLGYTIDSVVDPNNNPMVVGVWDVSGWDESEGTPTKTLRYKYTLPHMEIMNGGIIRNGIMYIMCTPFQFSDYTFIAVSPIEAKAITNRWHFSQKTEYENINFVDDKTIIYGAYWFYKAKLKTLVI